MSSEGNRRKKVVWQDIVPMKPVAKAPIKKRSIVMRLMSRLRPRSSRLKDLLKRPYKRLIIVILIAVALLGVLTGAWYLLRPNSEQTTPTAGTGTNAPKPAGDLVPGTASYAVLLPDGKTIKDLGGGWVRDQSHPLFIYLDTIDTVNIKVSEQPLPDSLKTDTEQAVELIAKNYDITQKVTVGDTTIHIGTFGNGIQRIILSKAHLLILITSNNTLTNDQWIGYINSLN